MEVRPFKVYTMCLSHKVLFSKSAKDKIHQLAENPSTNDEAKRAALLLQNSVNVINEVGQQNFRENNHYNGSWLHAFCFSF